MGNPLADAMLADIIRSLKALPFSGHAHAIGYLCITWSYLETTIDLLLSLTADLSDPPIRKSIIHNADMRDKVKMLHATGFIKKPSDDWYSELRDTLNRIDEKLRPERNRMVHDAWIAKEGEILRQTKLAKVVHEQAKQLALQTVDEKPIAELEVWDAVTKVQAETGRLIELLNAYVQHQIKKKPQPQASGAAGSQPLE